MRSFSEFARQLGAGLPRRWQAAGANLLLSLRRGDQRRFDIDSSGHWVNRQPEMTIVSPDLHTAHHYQVQRAVLDNWCHHYAPKSGDTVIDVGAGIGEEAVIFSQMTGKRGLVVCIEAHPNTFKCLEQTVRRSRLTNVIPVHCAISDRDGPVEISDGDDHLGNRLLGGAGGLEVPGRSLDSLLGELGIDAVDLLKMNIEGAELAAIAGLRTIAPLVKRAAISCHDFVADAGGANSFRTLESVSAALLGYGFELRRRKSADRPWLRDIVYANRAGVEPAC